MWRFVYFPLSSSTNIFLLVFSKQKVLPFFMTNDVLNPTYSEIYREEP